MEKRVIGQQGLEVSSLGLGCMGLSSSYYGPFNQSASIKVLHHALELGIDFWDTAEMYGPFINEELIGLAIKGKPRDSVILATKFAWEFGPKGERLGLNGSPGHIKKTIQGSLKRLGTEYIDLYYQHRLDPQVPIEETMMALSDLVKAGYIRYIGLSEVGPGTIRRAHQIHPLSVVQSEYSLWERGVEAKVLFTLRELGIGFVAYSPLGRGFLSGKLTSLANLAEGDWRRHNPRFQGDNFKHNLNLVHEIQKISTEYKVTAAQIALAWLLRQGGDIVPIPGTKQIEHLEENIKALEISLPEFVWQKIDLFLSKFQTYGDRYSAETLKWIDTTE